MNLENRFGGEMKQLRALVYLAVILCGPAAFSQALDPVYNINKTPAKMQTESTQARQYFNHATDDAAPRKFDLLKTQTPVRDQGHRGTCVAFASIALVEAMYKVKTGQDINLSEQYAYWDSKAVEHISAHSEGSYPLPFLKSIEKDGVPVQQAWPYELTAWYDDEKGHPDCFKANKQHAYNISTVCLTNGMAPASAVAAPKIRIIQPHTVPSAPEAIMGFLQQGMVVEIAVDVYDKAWSYSQKTSPGYLTGTVTMPPPGDKAVGGHAVLIVGYDMDRQVFLFKNSWGIDRWASQSPVRGYGVIPFEYIRKFADATVARMP